MSNSTDITDGSSSQQGWFPIGRQDLPGWRFDVITLLAVIGESSVAVHAQTMTASTLCLFPRIIPAPQALLKPVRPRRLPEVTAKMAGVYGGTVLDTVGFFANIMHPLEDLKPFAFKVLEIRHKDLNQVGGFRMTNVSARADAERSGFQRWLRRKGGRRSSSGGGGEQVLNGSSVKGKGKANGNEVSGGLGGLSKIPEENKHVTFELNDVNKKKPAAVNIDPDDLEKGVIPPENESKQSVPVALGKEGEGGPVATEEAIDNNKQDAANEEEEEDDPAKRKLQRRVSLSVKMTDFITNPTMVNKQERYAVPPAYYSPLHVVSLLSCLLSMMLVGLAGYWEDGTAMVAIILMSLASTVTCYASWWRPLLMHRPTTNKVPPGDVVIRTREGAFVLIRCREEVARELYSGTEECQYVSTRFHRVFMGLGMVLLMVAVVLLGNCGWYSQVSIGAAYILLNGIYWLMGLLPATYFWDLSRYTMEDVTPEDAKNAHEKTSEDPREGAPSFTRTLWFAIRETQHGAWVERSGAMPGTDQWKKWLNEAVDAAWRKDRLWPAVGRKNEIMKENPDSAPSPSSTTSGSAAASLSAALRRRHPDEAEQRAPLHEVQPRFVGERTGTFGQFGTF